MVFVPGRIDLGLGRTSGTDIITAMALRRNLGGLEEEEEEEEEGW